MITLIEQGTDAWKLQRLGFVTASRVADVLAKVKSGEAKTREKYRYELITQRLTGKIVEGYTNDAMAWGTEHEPYARMQYEARTGDFVQVTGFHKHPTIDWVGASPDGFVGDDGLIEIKCPNTETHLRTLEADKPPTQYIPQMQMQMWVTNRDWCDFVSYDPRLPDDLGYFCAKVWRDDTYIKIMELEVLDFLAEVETTITNLRSNHVK